MTTWHRYRFRGCIPHCVCGELRRQLLADLADRYPTEAILIDSCVIATWRLDYGGVYVDPPVERFAWCGLQLKVPCADVGQTEARLKPTELRVFGDGTPHYKLKGAASCIVMTSMQASALREQLAARAELAERRAMAFSRRS